jgi:lipopolysaccharide transport system ATP-binding protein
MSETVIKVENLSKRYRLGELHSQTGSFREKVTQAFSRISHKTNVRGSNSLPQNTKRSALCAMPSLSNDAIWALKDVSFQVKRGEIVGIIGRNGAGKSTLLKILSRITKPTEGRTLINGRVGSLLEVGTGFHAELTGRENVYLNGAILGMTKAEIRRKFDKIIDFAEIKKFIDTPVKRYSSGMYVRLAFAVAAYLDPEILLIDEVLSVGDSAFQKKCLGKINQITNTGKTVILVSHNMSLVSSLCGQVILLNSGQLNFQGLPSDAISKYMKITNTINSIPISNRNFNGDGNIRVLDIVLRNIDGMLTSCFQTGDDISIVIKYSSVVPLFNISFEVGIYDHLNRRLSLLSSSVTGHEINLDIGISYFECFLYSVPLFQGKYSLNVAIVKWNKLLFGLEHAIDFEIVNSDFYGTGKLPKFGPLLLKYKWKHSN